jgi:hypothetical protein
LRRRIRAGFQLPFERPDFPDVLLEFLLGMAIGFVNSVMPVYTGTTQDENRAAGVGA